MKPNIAKAEQFVKELHQLLITHSAKLDHNCIDVAGVSLDIADGTVKSNAVYLDFSTIDGESSGSISYCGKKWKLND